MHESVMKFGRENILANEIKDKSVLEVGSLDVNGSLREYILSMNPKEYIGTDMREGEKVDKVVDAVHLIKEFGRNSFDFIVCTEMLEHARDYMDSLRNMVGVCKKGGYILITTRSPGFPQHDYPNDYWRFTKESMEWLSREFNLEVIKLEDDTQASGVFVKYKK